MSETRPTAKVLIVDADPDKLATLTVALTTAAYHVTSATSASFALTTLERAAEMPFPEYVRAAVASGQDVDELGPRLETRVGKLEFKDGAPSADTAAKVGSVLADRYIVKEKLGEGGMGEVYLAEHVVIERKVTHPLLPFRILANRNRATSFVVMIVNGIAGAIVRSSQCQVPGDPPP